MQPGIRGLMSSGTEVAVPPLSIPDSHALEVPCGADLAGVRYRLQLLSALVETFWKVGRLK